MVRKPCAGTIAVCGILLGLCAIAGPSTCVALLWASLAVFGAGNSNVFAISQRLAGPHAAGRWVGFQNGIGNLAGVVVPVVTGFVLGRTGSFFWAFAIMTTIALIGTASWLFVVGPVEQVDWGSASRRAPLVPTVSAAAAPESVD